MADSMNHQPNQLEFSFSPDGGDDGEFGHNTAIMTMQRLIDGFVLWKPQLERALAYGGMLHTVDDVFKMAIQGKVHCYFFDRCFIIMEIAEYAQAKIYHGFLTGGDMQAILDKEEDMGKLAVALGCSYLSIAGRHGWKKVFEDRGWNFVCVTMHKDLRDEQR